ncbi:LptE family protein [Aquimarina addita]|uniref:LptE family protein n=1 Tax=Aquimarina addita TaxID=870485 RepID=A0ABP6UMX5_9FLAO
MRNLKYILITIIGIFILEGCGAYSFSGISISPETKTFQVNFFQNQAPLVNPGVDQTFTNELQDLILNQTNLDLVTSNGDLVYEGEITEDRVAPTTATSDNEAAQNRLTISVNVRFYDSKDPTQDLEQRFSFFYDFASTQSESDVRDTALDEIFERITQDIFNATLAKW